MHPAVIRLSKRLTHDVSGNTLDLDVHLDCRDSLACSCYLEVHVTKEIFHPLDVRQHRVVAFAVGNKAHCHTGYRCLDRHAGVQECQR